MSKLDENKTGDHAGDNSNSMGSAHDKNTRIFTINKNEYSYRR